MSFDVFRKPLTVIRKEAGSHQDYKWVPGAEVEIQIKASVQPITGSKLSVMPEGYRERGLYKLFTDTELKTVGTGTRDPDIVVIGSSKYTCEEIREWQNGIIPHYEVIVSRIDDDAVQGNT